MRLFIVVGILLSITACGGGGGDDAPPATTTPTTSPTTTPPIHTEEHSNFLNSKENTALTWDDGNWNQTNWE